MPEYLVKTNDGRVHRIYANNAQEARETMKRYIASGKKNNIPKTPDYIEGIRQGPKE